MSGATPDWWEGRFWLEVREPRCVPDRKGPFQMRNVAATLREFMEARPTALLTVITWGHDGPLLQDGPECLMMADGRSTSRAMRHIRTSAAALAKADPLSMADRRGT